MKDNESLIIEYSLDNGEVFGNNELTKFRFTNYKPDKRCEKRTVKWEVKAYDTGYKWKPVSISRIRRDFKRLPYLLEISVTKKIDYTFWM